MSNKEHPFTIKLIKSLYYSITIKTSDQEKALNLIYQIIDIIRAELISNNATFKIVKSPELIFEEKFEPESSDL